MFFLFAIISVKLARSSRLLKNVPVAARLWPEARPRAETSCVQTLRFARLHRRGNPQEGESCYNLACASFWDARVQNRAHAQLMSRSAFLIFFFFSTLDHRNWEHDGQDSQRFVRVQHQSAFGGCQVRRPSASPSCPTVKLMLIFVCFVCMRFVHLQKYLFAFLCTYTHMYISVTHIVIYLLYISDLHIHELEVRTVKISTYCFAHLLFQNKVYFFLLLTGMFKYFYITRHTCLSFFFKNLFHCPGACTVCHGRCSSSGRAFMTMQCGSPSWRSVCS